MKTRIINFLILLIILCSCNEDFIDLEPISNVTTVNFYKTPEDIYTAVNAAYSTLQLGGVYGSDHYIFGELPSDNSQAPSTAVTYLDEFDRFYVTTTNPYLNYCWGQCYKGISSCNIILDNINDVDLNSTLKDRYIGEVKFLRALIYFKLVQVFGDVPLVLNNITNPYQGYEYERSPKADVYVQIEKDLNEAVPVLPKSYGSSEVGRATKGAAAALLGRILLTQKKYDYAATILESVIEFGEEGIYDLLTNYQDCFKASGKNHKESVFDVQYKSGGIGEGNSIPNLWAPPGSGNAVINFSGQGQNQPTTDLGNEYEDGDLRKDLTIAFSFISDDGTYIEWPYCKKYWDAPKTVNDNNNNFPLIRFADVLLMYAECLNEMGYVADGIAFEYLNKIRNRAGLKSMTSIDIPDQNSFRMAIEHERRVEFAFEGLRWFDLVRTDRAITVLNSKASSIGLSSPLTENNLVFPIPQSQIDLSKNLIQNFGY